MKPRRRPLDDWQISLVRLLYPTGGPSEQLCLAVGLTAHTVIVEARELGVPAPSLCTICKERPRRDKRHCTCEPCDHIRRKARLAERRAALQNALPSPPPIDEAEERRRARASGLAEALSHDTLSKADLRLLGFPDTTVSALIADAPHWYEGCLRYGLSLSAEGLKTLLGEAPAPSAEEQAQAERNALEARIEALAWAVGELAVLLNDVKGKAAQTKAKRKRRESVGQLHIWPRLWEEAA